MIVGDILEITLYQKYLDSVEVRNVLHYRVNSVGTLDESGLSIAFNLEVLPAFVAVQSATIQHYKQTVLNLTDNLGWADVDLIPDVPGDLAGDVMPPFVCWAFRKNRGTRLTRSGQMRIAGITEGAVGNGLAEASIQDDLDALAVALGQGINDGTGGVYAPRIVRKTATGVLDLANTIDSVEYVSVSSQTSRKYGRGI